jgi:hypothetical protein
MRKLVLLLAFLFWTISLAISPLWAETEGRSVDFDWYKTQFGSGGTGNCGPASAAMAIHWATGRDISVRDVRKEIGEPNGSRATSLDHQKWVIARHGIKAVYTHVSSTEELVGLLKRGNIAILWIHTAKIRMPKGNVAKTREGRYYPDECGHYIILHGVSPDGKFFIVHDPAPGDWATNTVRYPDGGMLGRNRYFSVSEVWASLKQKRVIEVYRKKR